MDPIHPLIPVLNMLTTVLVFLTLISISFRKAWNIGVLLLGGWVMVRTFFRGVEGIVWRDSTKDLAPVWCDISTHLVIGSLFGGQPACSLIITRQLHRVTQLYSPERLTRKEKRRELLFNLLIGVGLPFLIIILYTIVQDCRYIITEDVGCSPSMDGTILTLCVVHTWAVALPLYSAVRYCPGIIKELWVHSGQMAVVLPVLPEIDRARYMRVLFIACIDIVITLPVGAIVLAEALMQSGQEKLPWFPDWPTLHQHWDPIVELATDWQSSTSQRFTIYFAQISGLVLGVAFVALFGTSEEGIKAYRHAFWATARMFGWRRRVRLEVPAGESTLEFESPEPSPSYHSPITSTFSINLDLHSPPSYSTHRRSRSVSAEQLTLDEGSLEEALSHPFPRKTRATRTEHE